MSTALGGRYPVAHVQFELTNRCNLRCVECPHRNMKRPHADMSEATLDAILERILMPYPVVGVTTSIGGEPTLHRHFIAMLCRLTAVHHGQVDIYTNGLRYTRDMDAALRQMPARFRVLTTFHYYDAEGRRVEYAAVADEVRACLERPKANMEYVVTTHATKYMTEEALAAWQAEWRAAEGQYPSLSAAHVNRSVSTWAGQVEGNIENPYCIFGGGTHLFIGATGNILPCCGDMEEELTLGNLLADPLEELMERRAAFYDSLRDNGPTARLCRACLPPYERPAAGGAA